MTEPDKDFCAGALFRLSEKWRIRGFSQATEHVPRMDDNYHFDPKTTRAVLAGFKHNRRVLIQGYHGSGKSSHIEQVAARLNWPCIRVNLDSHISRIDLIGKDAIKLRDGKQVTEFHEGSHISRIDLMGRDGISLENGKQVTRFRDGVLPWSVTRPMALVLDEYDAARPDVMFVIQQLLEADGKLNLLDRNKVLTPHPCFRLFATANTIGMGDATGLYHGTQILNQGQLDRWNIVACLNYLGFDQEVALITRRFKNALGENRMTSGMIQDFVRMAGLSRQGFIQGDLSTAMSTRTVISWVENYLIFKDIAESFEFAFYNRCDDTEQEIIKEYYYRCFAQELTGA